jgi:5-methylcytosine-specific restriction endonuclease McrA
VRPRLTFCSDACIHEWKIRTQPNYAKLQVAKRDDGICQLCRVDTMAAIRPRHLHNDKHTSRALSSFDMDHIVPVVEGGGACGLDNLRTLCRPCHRAVTAELAKRRAAARRAAGGKP